MYVTSVDAGSGNTCAIPVVGFPIFFGLGITLNHNITLIVIFGIVVITYIGTRILVSYAINGVGVLTVTAAKYLLNVIRTENLYFCGRNSCSVTSTIDLSYAGVIATLNYYLGTGCINFGYNCIFCSFVIIIIIC